MIYWCEAEVPFPVVCLVFTISCSAEGVVGSCIQNTFCWLRPFLLSSIDAYLLLSSTANLAICS